MIEGFVNKIRGNEYDPRHKLSNHIIYSAIKDKERLMRLLKEYAEAEQNQDTDRMDGLYEDIRVGLEEVPNVSARMQYLTGNGFGRRAAEELADLVSPLAAFIESADALSAGEIFNSIFSGNQERIRDLLNLHKAMVTEDTESMDRLESEIATLISTEFDGELPEDGRERMEMIRDNYLPDLITIARNAGIKK